MKRILLLCVLLNAAMAAKADFVIKQKVSDSMQASEITFKFKGNQVRMEMNTGAAGFSSVVLVDLATGDSTTLIPQQKMMFKMSGAQMKQTIEQTEKMMTNANATPPKLVDTGKTELVGGYQSEIYTWTNAFLKAGGTVWLAKDYPNMAAIKVQMEMLAKIPFVQLKNKMMPNSLKLPGLEIKTKSAGSNLETTTTLISAKSEPVADSEFIVPGDYRQPSIPGAPPTFRPPVGPIPPPK